MHAVTVKAHLMHGRRCVDTYAFILEFSEEILQSRPTYTGWDFTRKKLGLELIYIL